MWPCGPPLAAAAVMADVVGSADWRPDTNYESVVMARSLALPAP